MTIKLKYGLLAALPLAMGLTAGSAQAGSLEAQFFYDELNQSSDNSGESQNVDLNNNNWLDIGDTLRGTFDMQTNECVSCFPSVPTNNYGPTNNELSGIFEAEVMSKTFVNVGLDGILNTGDDVYTFKYGPSAAFAAEFGLAPGALVAVFEDLAPGDYSRTGTIPAAEASATNGVLRLVVGFGVDAGIVDPVTGAVGDEQWTGTSAQSPAIANFIPVGQGFGVFNFDLSVITNNFDNTIFGLVLAQFPNTGNGDGLINFNAQGGLVGTLGATTGYDVWNNVDFVFRPQYIPEPSIVALMGLGLLGIGAAGKRKRA